MGNKILVVEGEAKIARTLSLYLEQAGFNVTISPTGTDALLSFRREGNTPITPVLNQAQRRRKCHAHCPQ